MKKKELLRRLRARNDKRPFGAFMMLLFFALFLNAQNIYSQDNTITGTVKDAAGLPLPGATILEKGTNNGTITNFDGEYSISVANANATLVISFVGFATVEQSVAGQSVIDIILQEDSASLEEVVVIGYGSIQKKDLTGAISTLSSDELTTMASPNFEQGIQGKVPGLQMTQTSAEPGGGISVRVRGVSSLLGSSEPLYVIDGFPIENDNSSRPGGWEVQGSLNLLSNLNPNDIESVQVLKDASATSIYGSRGANGVILIETKKGRSGDGTLTVEYSHSFSTVNNPFSFAGVEDFARIENERLDHANATIGSYRYLAQPTAYWPAGGSSPEQLGALYGQGTDWIEAVLQPGTVDNVNLSFSGGDDKTTYHLSGNLYDETGVVVNSDYIRASFRANVSSQINKRVKITATMSSSRYEADRFLQTQRIAGGGPDRLGTIAAAFRANPIADAYVDPLLDNNLMKLVPGTGGVENFIYSPVRELDDQDNSDEMNFFMSTLKLEIDLMDGLKMTFNGGANMQNQERVNFMPFTTHVGNWYSGIGAQTLFKKRDFLFENYLNYNKDLGEAHKINATLGYSMQNARRQTTSLNGTGYDFDIQGIYGYSQQSNPIAPGVGEIGQKTASFYGRLFYSYDDRYLVTFSARQDGASVFAANKKWAFFPSVSAGWVLSEESFMQDVDWISNLKLRGSWGVVGNQAISPYRSLATLGATSYVLGGAKTSGLGPNTPANPDLIWESTEQLDIGFDASLFEGRMNLGFDYYKKNTVDLLQNKPVPGTTGYSVFTTNFGEIQNEGMEVMLGGTILERELGWKSSVTASYNRSEILDLGLAADGTPILDAAVPGGANGGSFRFIVGEPIGTFVGYTVDGLLQQADIDAGVPVLGALNQAGHMKVKDIDGDGNINNNDITAIGNAQPDVIFGWDNTFTYKNWDLNAFVNAVIGGEVLNTMKRYTSMGDRDGVPTQEYADDYWSPENTDAKFPKPGGGLAGTNTWMLEDATFIRLQSLALNYRVPLDKLNINGISSASIYVRGTNLFVITDYSGFDPETGFTGQVSYAPNVDLGNYPRPTTVNVGFKVSF